MRQVLIIAILSLITVFVALTVTIVACDAKSDDNEEHDTLRKA